jgi:two-component system NtrC family sensor kinase
VIGALGVSVPPPRTLPPRQRAALARLAASVALALDTLLLRQEERRQQGRQRMLATALETMQQPVFVCTPDGVIQYANGAAAREYGYAPEEFVGMAAQQLAAPSSDVLAGDIDTVLATGGGWARERVHRRRNGSEFPAWVTLNVIRDGNWRVLGLVGSARNLTEERRVAEQLRQSEKMAALGELVAGVAHEVNNPLTSISAFAQLLLEDDGLTEDQQESVRIIKQATDRAVAVIRDLLAFARKSGPRTVPINANELVEQTLRLRAYSLRTQGIRVEYDLAEDLRPLQGDDRQLQQVFLNLLVNAEHAMAGAPRRAIRVRTANEGERVVIEVADTGMGMTPEVQKRIFEPFFTTKPEGTGTGLGLSVSYGIVQAHGGQLTVQSAPGAGATFRIALPAADDELLDDPDPVSTGSASRTHA